MDTMFVETQSVSAGLLVGRVVLGLLMAAHGAQKLFGWFGGHGLNTTGEFFGQLGFRPGRLFAFAASAGEVTSGLLVALGFLGPIGPAVMVAVMIVAAITVHWRNGMFATANGIELPLVYAAGAAALALTGFGRYSVDAVLGLTPIWTPAIVWSVLGLGLVGGVANLALRRPVPAQRAA